MRSLGLAQLENERTGDAAETFRKLAKLVPDDPLPYADLAVAALRQQKSEEASAAIAQALAKAPPGRADLLAVLLAIQGDVLQWSGKGEEALAVYRKAAAAAPDRVEIQYGLYRLAGQGSGPEAEAGLKDSLQALARLRPENLVVLLQQGQRAIAAGDRAGATQAFLRVRELLGSTPAPAAAATLAPVLAALEANDLAAARVPAIRLENVLKPTPPYQQGLHELSTGLLGNPVERLVNEPPPSSFGDPVRGALPAAPLAKGAVAGRALATGDFDGDGKPDLAWIEAGETPRLLLLKGSGGDPVAGPEAAGIDGLIAADLDNDGKLDLIGFGPKRMAFWRGKGDGTFEDATAGGARVDRRRGRRRARLRHRGGPRPRPRPGRGSSSSATPSRGRWTAVGKQTFPPMPHRPHRRPRPGGDRSRPRRRSRPRGRARRRGSPGSTTSARVASRTAPPPPASPRPVRVEALASADLDNDGRPDLIAAGPDGLSLWHNLGAAASPPGTSRGCRAASASPP